MLRLKKQTLKKKLKVETERRTVRFKKKLKLHKK